jgi:hypothetical protein
MSGDKLNDLAIMMMIIGSINSLMINTVTSQ